jgi:hypothetical protein
LLLSTSGVNGISAVPDVLNSNPAVQSVDARKPVIENSANGLPCMRFATNDVLAWPITPQSAGGLASGYALWFRPDSVAVTNRLTRIAAVTGGASGTRLSLTGISSAMQGIASSNGTNTRANTTSSGVITTGWNFATIEYDPDGVTEVERLTVTVNGVPMAGTFSGSGVLTALFVATGNMLIGNGIDDGSGSGPLNGLIGPNIFAFGSKMPGATTGLLTATARTALMNFEAPT